MSFEQFGDVVFANVDALVGEELLGVDDVIIVRVGRSEEGCIVGNVPTVLFDTDDKAVGDGDELGGKDVNAVFDGARVAFCTKSP